MLYVIIGYFLFSFFLIGVSYYVIKHYPSIWEDEIDLHAVEQQKQQPSQLTTDLGRSSKLHAGSA